MNPLNPSRLDLFKAFLPVSSHRIHYLRKSLLRDGRNILTWSFLVLFVLFVYHFLSDGDFSFLLTLSSIVGSFGFVLVLYKVSSSRSVEGLSLKSIVLYCVVSLSRLVSVLPSDAYLPFDRSGDWIYRGTEILGAVAVLLLLGTIQTFRYTYYSYIDKFAGTNPRRAWRLILLVVGILFVYSIAVHPGLSRHPVLDVMWCFSHYVEAVAVYPQLVLFSRSRKGEVESFTSHFVFSLAVSRCLALLFWCSCWRELNSNTNWIGTILAGRSVLLSQFIQIVLMGNYVYHYVKSCLSGTPLILPIYRGSREECFCLLKHIIYWKSLICLC